MSYKYNPVTRQFHETGKKHSHIKKRLKTAAKVGAGIAAGSVAAGTLGVVGGTAALIIRRKRRLGFNEIADNLYALHNPAEDAKRRKRKKREQNVAA